MESPRTPKSAAEIPEAQTPITPRHQKTIIDNLTTLSQQVGAAKDQAEKEAMLRQISQFTASLMKYHGLEMPNAQVKSSANQAFEDSDEEISEDEDDLWGVGIQGSDAQPDGETGQPAAKVTTLVVKEMPRVSLGMSPELDLAALVAARDAFEVDLLALRMTVEKDKKTMVDQRFTQDQAREITQLFFGEVISYRGLQRLNSLINVYNSHDVGQLDMGVGARAGALAADLSIPQTVRRLFGALTQVESRRVTTSTILHQLITMSTNLILHQKWENFKAEAEGGNVVIRQFLTERGYTTRPGVTWTSCAFQYIRDALKLPKNKALWNTLRWGVGLSALVNYFGDGILVFLPDTTPGKLNNWGNRKMIHVYDLLSKHVGGFGVICKIVEQNVYIPIKTGQAINMKNLKLGPSKSETLLERINAAVEASQAELNDNGLDDDVEMEAE